MDRAASHNRGFDGMEETRCMIKRGLNQNCQEKTDFIEDVLLQKDLYASYDMIQANPAYEPSYTFMEPDSPISESNPTSLLNETDKQPTLVKGTHGVSKADWSYGTEKGDILLTVDPIFNAVVEGHNYEEDPPTQVFQQHINANLMPEFLCVDGDVPDKQSFDLAAVDALHPAMNITPVERTIDVADYEVEPIIQVEQKSVNIEGLKLSHTENRIITKLADHGIDQKREGADLDISDLPQLGMDAIPMESILEGFDDKVPFMQVECDYMNIDSLGQMLSGIENASEPVDMYASDSLQVDDNAIPTGQTEEISRLFTDKENREAIVLERNVPSPVPQGSSLGKPSLEGQSRSKSPINSRERHRRSRSISWGRYSSPANRRNCCSSSKLLMQSQSPVKRRDCCYRRSSSQSVTNCGSGQRRSCRSRAGIYSRDHQRRSNSQSRVNSRDCHRRSQSQLKLGMDSRDCSRRTWSRSRSPITLRDHNRRSRSRSPSNSRGFHWRSQSRSVTNSRSSHRRSRSCSRSGIYSRDHHRRSYSRSRVSSRDSHRRSQSRLKFGIDSRDCNRRTQSRSRSPVTFKDHRRRSRSRSPKNSRGFYRRSQSQSSRAQGPLKSDRSQPKQ